LTKSDLKQGCGRFEIILEAMGISGSIESELRRDLLELSQIRNVLVHRAGIVDKRFIEICPWLKMCIGDHIKVTNEAYCRYSIAVPRYIGTVIKRLKKYS
jgi:hypothetical protein